MVGAGYAAQAAAGTPAALWPLFLLGAAAQLAVFAQQYAHVNKPESAQLYNFLFGWHFVTMNLVTLVMVLDVAGLLPSDYKALGYVTTELLATVFFFFFLVGAHEGAEQRHTIAGGIAEMVVGDCASLPREKA